METSDAHEVFSCINSCSYKTEGDPQREDKAASYIVDSAQSATC